MISRIKKHLSIYIKSNYGQTQLKPNSNSNSKLFSRSDPFTQRNPKAKGRTRASLQSPSEPTELQNFHALYDAGEITPEDEELPRFVWADEAELFVYNPEGSYDI